MSRLRKLGVLSISCALLGVMVHESIHYHRYGHLVPPGLHADIVVSIRDDLLGFEGNAKIYDAKVTNYGILPASMTVCDYQDSGSPETMVAHFVERWDQHTAKWIIASELGGYGSRLFCRLSFEVTETHLVQRRMWPGESIRVGQVDPVRGGSYVKDDLRFIVFPHADGNPNTALSTPAFRLDKQKPSKGHRSFQIRQ